MLKKIFSLIAVFAALASIQAQSPETFSFQAIVRDATNQIIADTQVGVQISILQGTANGSSVYVETHALTTSVAGVMSTQIGAGSVVSGDFSAIDWSAGPYFVKTEIDPAGGTTYTITSVTQMVSVPYALHSTTASSATTASILGDGITQAHIDDINQRLQALEPDPQIGDFRHGGIVFWIDPLNPKHGMVVSMENLNNNLKCNWSQGANQVTGASGTAIGTGKTNTETIIAAHGPGNYAAYICHTYTYGIYSGWHLPSVDECYEVYLNITAVAAGLAANGGQAISGLYWASNENGQDYAALKYLSSGGGGGGVKIGYPQRVRAVREF